MALKREDYLSWDEYFMGVAILSSMRSKDPNTQVGVCVVDNSNRILSIGYNGAPNGFNDDIFPWDREGHMLETKYAYVVHAERNAILNYRGSRKDMEGAKEIVQSGIKEVIYLSDKYHDTDETRVSRKLFDECGVSYRQLNEESRRNIEINMKSI